MSSAGVQPTGAKQPRRSSFAAWLRGMQVRARAAALRLRGVRLGRLRWLLYAAMGIALLAAVLVGMVVHHLYFDRTDLPDIEAFSRFEFPTVGSIYDTNGQPVIELAREYRRITKYEDIPPVIRDAVLAAEDSNFFSHNGIDYSRIPHVLIKGRLGSMMRLTKLGHRNQTNSRAIFPQGGSTITQQLVRGHFLQYLTTQENSNLLRHDIFLPRLLSYLIGARSVNMLVRKLEEIRLSLWVEEEMRRRFGSKRRAKEEILARYVSFIYLGNGRYGFATAAEYYFGRSLASFTMEDADKAALLAGIAKSPRTYAPNAKDADKVVHRRNQILALMVSDGFISKDRMTQAEQQPVAVIAHDKPAFEASAVVDNVLEELKAMGAGFNAESLFQGHIQVFSTADARVQRIVNEALEHGIEIYEKRHPKARGLVQGSVVVLRNRDSGILAEAGGRRLYNERSVSYSDFNRVTKSLRQPGSAMKPIVYLAAFEQGRFNLESIVPDEPISVPNGTHMKSIADYDGQFKGMIPLRQALAESRNAVAIWITGEIGINSVLQASRALGVRTPLQPYVTTALGASEVNLMELANAYRALASGVSAEPYVIRKIIGDSGDVVADHGHGWPLSSVGGPALTLIQEGLRGVVRLPAGTAHALDSKDFPIAVMGKTGTTSRFRDALFLGSTFGVEGITVAVRIGFDDDRSLGIGETGGRVALPVFKAIMLAVYRQKLVGPPPSFPVEMENNIDAYLRGDFVERQQTALLGVPDAAAAGPGGTPVCPKGTSASPPMPCDLFPRQPYAIELHKESGRRIFANQ